MSENDYAPYDDEYAALEAFDESLNDIHEGAVTLFGYDYDPARVFQRVDPVAYREEFNNWLDAIRKDGEEEPQVLTMAEEYGPYCEDCHDYHW
jgi:hypothetical protein